MRNISYSDVLSMPTYERRYFIGLLTKDLNRKEEQLEQASNNGDGRNKKIGGDSLRTMMKNGNLPPQ